DKELNKMVAIKMIKNVFNNGAPYRMLREIKIMRFLRPHPNIVELIDVFVGTGEREYCLNNFKELYIVMGLMQDGDLKVFLNSLHKKKKAINLDFVKTIMYQLLNGMQYMQSFGVLHRDMKPANVLLSYQGDNVNVRISDFGLSNIESDNPGKNSKSLYVITRYYRPPEVILQYNVQSSSIDSWGLGCIMAELLYMLPPKPMRRPFEHLNLITSLLGKAKPEDIMGSDGCRDWYAQQFIDHAEEGISFDLVFPSASKEALDLLHQFLQWNPEKRISFSQALNHVFFKDVIVNSPVSVNNQQSYMIGNSPSSNNSGKAIAFNFEKEGNVNTMKFLYYHEMCRTARTTHH
ncbi:predicted protein, partial [Naegleria gruberi]